MGWTKEETFDFQTVNNKKLAEINATLKPDTGLSGKVGIFCHGQVGDLATVMSVLKYRKEVFGNKEIIWFANYPNAELLCHAPISEVRPWPWAGNGLEPGTPDFYPLLCDDNNRLNKELSGNYELTKDLDDGYFPATHMLTAKQRQGIDYADCARKVFGIEKEREWHPFLSWFNGEEFTVRFKSNRFKTGKTIMIETFFGSGQSKWDDAMTVETMRICREQIGYCNFIFASHKNTEQFKNEQGYFSLADFTPRVAALFINACDLFIGVSSGMSVVTSAWGLKPVPKIQFCGSKTCSTVALATGEIELITYDGLDLETQKEKFYTALKQMLNKL